MLRREEGEVEEVDGLEREEDFVCCRPADQTATRLAVAMDRATAVLAGTCSVRFLLKVMKHAHKQII